MDRDSIAASIRAFPEAWATHSRQWVFSQRELLVTGRFHAVCMAILTKTPFVAVTSNSWKIEALLADIGLDPARVQTIGALTPDLLEKDWAFSDAENRAMEVALPEWRTAAEIMFDQIAGLVPNPTQ